ncbi:hypothetical protein [Fibrivirga algicola]|uniref:Uncharacterized protein n=1 Tax=Fibrivirga algicola TaxID=2950420 RepID=A0ABX0QMN9_9BACT|nr:hypothetical protein [Fibrivirga algicola]NID13766.1 hypothetical protein [Fibrivirga algicola]
MPGTYKSIKDPGNASRMGGLQQRILLCPFSDFTTLQEPVDYKVNTAHVCAAGKGFFEVYSTKDLASLLLEAMGGPDRQSLKGKAEIYLPGESDDAVMLFNLAKNDRFIVLAPLPGSTEMIQCGDKEFQVNIRATYDTGKNSGDGRGMKFELEWFAANLVKYTAATVPMKPTT